jgi:hypothetical protein
MPTQDTHARDVQPPDGARPDASESPRRNVVERYRQRRATRKHRRLVSAHNRRVIAKWLRRTARHAQRGHPLADRRETLLHYRVAAVRADLLEIAALLERTRHPDAACVAALRELLANGCDSPLYNADIHISELQATLHYVRSGL